MSTVELVKNAIQATVTALIPDYSVSQYIWDSTLNSESKTKTYYSLRPSSIQFVSGTCNTITVEQQFTLEIGDSIRNKKDTDADADEKIYAIYSAHETIYKAIMRDNFGIPRVQVVSDFSISDPEINQDNKSVKIESTFTVRYRLE